jgi:ABC-2 type transport system permease protein
MSLDASSSPAAAVERVGAARPGPAESAAGASGKPSRIPRFNRYGVWAIYRFEMARFMRTLLQSVVTPVITTSLYFVVFGSAIGSRMKPVDGVSYGAFIVPGMIMLSVLTASISNASFGIYFPKFTGTIYELLSAPVSFLEMIMGYVGAAATKSILLGLIILATASAFVPLEIRHPIWMMAFLLLTTVTFSLFGFVIGIWAKGFEQLQFIPMLVVTPLTFLGGAFYSIDMLPAPWRTVTLFNPVVYLISGFRWSFYETADVAVGISLAMTSVFLLICLGVVGWMFKTGYRLKK